MKLFEAAKTVDIVEIYERITGKKPKATKKGAMVVCPFHDDKKPSMALYSDKNTFMCFGCHEYGSAIDLVMKLNNLDNRSAAEWICEEFGVEYEKPHVMSVAGPSEAGEEAYPIDIYLKINASLAAFFKAHLPHAPNPHFFDERGVGSLAEEFGFGYCPRGVIFTKNAELAMKLGYGDDKGECMFAGRYIVPLKDFKGNVIGFEGRLPDDEVDDAHPKYMNSRNSPIFNKRGVFFNAQAIFDKGHDEILVVEGVFDALAYIAAGVRNVVSPLGCALSDKHLDILRKAGSKKIVLGFDRDDAGRQATAKAIRYAKNLKVAILVADFKAQKDANALLLSEGSEYLSKATANLPAPEYLLRAYDRRGVIDTADGQEALWDAMAAAIGSREAEFRGKYPLNMAYNPVAFNRFWDKFDKLLENYPL